MRIADITRTSARLLQALCAAGCCVATLSPAGAQQVAADARPGAGKALEEVIVTAQKREERILDVPLAVTAFTGRNLQDTGAAQLADFLESAPGVGIIDTQQGLQNVQIRGVTSSFGDAPVGFYLDELPITFIGTTAVPDVRTYDLERVEVLRGPQGTLYGDGSIGGTIRILTNEPDLQDFQGEVDLSMLNTSGGEDSYAAKAFLNAPLKEDMLAVRLVASKEDFGGWIDNSVSGEDDANDRDIVDYRAKIRLAPTDSVDLVLSAWHDEADSIDGAQSTADYTTPNPRVVRNAEYDLYSLTGRIEFGAFDVLSATSVMDLSYLSEGELFGLPLITDQNTDVVVEELRATSTGDGMFRWTAGLFYRKIEIDIFAQVFTFTIDQFSDSESYAAFSEGTWSMLDDRLELTLGLRYFEDDRVRDDPVDPATLALIQTIDPTFTGRVESNFDSLNPRFNLAYHPNQDWMVYTNIAKGFRSGQVQPVVSLIQAVLTGTAVPIGIDPETLLSYELGTKGTLADGRVTIEGAVYYNDWDNLQVTVILDPTTLLSAFVNAGAARTLGAELSANWQPVDGLNLRFSASHLDSQFTKNVPGANITEGDRVSNVPEATLSAGGSYRWPLTSRLTALVYGSAQYTSDRVDVVNLAAPSDETTVVDLRLGLEGSAWGVYLFGENLTNENGAIEAQLPTSGGLSARARPRTYGVNLRYSFR